MEYNSLKKILKNKYIIPCFQREYSWEKEEIEDLLDDIKNCNDEYCAGIITTKTEDGNVLLIDGQQRLTTLYMIAIITGYIETKEQILLEKEMAQEFKKLKSKEDNYNENEESNDLKRLFDNQTNDIPPKLLCGWKIIKSKINDNKNDIKNKLNNLRMYVLNLDDDITDLNHYFEVMNSRGVQLSRSDIVKANLMKTLTDPSDRQRLNNLWYLLEDMKDIRKKCKNSKSDYFHSISSKSATRLTTIKDILKNLKKEKIETEDDNNLIKDDNKILNLDYFLLYTIRLYNEEELKNDDKSDIQNKMFELKDLDDEYRKCFINATSDDVIKFLNFLIKTKINYETYIVRYDNNDGLYKININNNEILKLQTCLRVSFTNRKVMHWIYETLKYFNNDENKEKNYVKYIRNFIRSYIADYINKTDNKEINYATGTDTPHIVLNYLDYLISVNKNKLKSEIPELEKIKIKNNPFKVRNSVEHYMPRENEKGYTWFDDFGNLALLSYSTNSHIQNAMPAEKNQYFKDHNLNDYSIKLQIMYYMTTPSLDKKIEWTELLSNKLTDKCIKILKDDLEQYKN